MATGRRGWQWARRPAPDDAGGEGAEVAEVGSIKTDRAHRQKKRGWENRLQGAVPTRGPTCPSKTWLTLAQNIVFVCDNCCFSSFGVDPWHQGALPGHWWPHQKCYSSKNTLRCRSGVQPRSTPSPRRCRSSARWTGTGPCPPPVDGVDGRWSGSPLLPGVLGGMSYPDLQSVQRSSILVASHLGFQTSRPVDSTQHRVTGGVHWCHRSL